MSIGYFNQRNFQNNYLTNSEQSIYKNMIQNHIFRDINEMDLLSFQYLN